MAEATARGRMIFTPPTVTFYSNNDIFKSPKDAGVQVVVLEGICEVPGVVVMMVEGGKVLLVVDSPSGMRQPERTINTGDNARLIVACSSRDDFAK